MLKNFSSISELSETLFIQHHTVKKALDRVKTILKLYRLTLYRSPLRIEGPEINKRELCTDVLYNYYLHKNIWPFEHYCIHKIGGIVKDSSNRMNMNLNPPSHKRIVLYTGVMLHSFMNNRKIEMDLHPSVLQNVINSKYFDLASDICEEIVKLYPSHIIPFEEKVVLSIQLSTQSEFNADDQDMETTYQLFQKQSTSFYRELAFLVDKLEKNTGIKLADNMEFIYSLHKQYKAYSLYKFIAKKESRINAIIEYTQIHYPKLFEMVHLTLDEWCEAFHFPAVSNLIVARVTLNIQTIINLKTAEKRVLIFNSEGDGVQRYNISLLKKEFGNKIHFIRYQNGLLSPNEIKEMNVDFIISDYQLDIEYPPVIILNTILSDRDISQISKYLTQSI